MNESEQYLAKARQSLQGAESEFDNKRLDNATNRAYYACFQAALAALSAAGVPIQRDKGDTISHQAVPRNFSGLLIKRRKLYPSSLRSVLQELLSRRTVADYRTASVSKKRASSALRLAKKFVNEVQSRLSSK